MRLAPVLAALFALVSLALPAAAAQDCLGRNLFQSMAPARLAELRAATDRVPYHHGLFWRAEKDGQAITLIGTYHFADPRHEATLRRFRPALAEAGALLVEAGPEEEARLAAAMSADPGLIVNPKGPTLPERLSEREWAALSRALAQRGLPAVIASRLRPWYVAVMLGVSPCMMRLVEERGDAGGLDHLLTEAAAELDLPVRALEPWDTVLTLFAGMTPAEEEDMIRAALPAAEHADDYAVTLSDAYFAGESWMIWEFGRFDAYDRSGMTRAAIDAQMHLAQDRLMDRRNRGWIAPLEAAAAEAARQGKGVVAAFGALHLPGKQGVLRLLEERGWRISPIEMEGTGHGG
ncbi:TraB/GumN family protein [Paracoccus sp. (in: a-proteobacteria)]|uniref:TraB/GumN family protein n=1 Tax=Paracoccus sp. TaxID=267 RepID=UPI00321FF06E